jgi:hypothetical protein
VLSKLSLSLIAARGVVPESTTTDILVVVFGFIDAVAGDKDKDTTPVGEISLMLIEEGVTK